MNTITIELTNKKAYRLLRDMEELNLIKMLQKKEQGGISMLRKQIRQPLNEKEINQQLTEMRKEWER